MSKGKYKVIQRPLKSVDELNDWLTENIDDELEKIISISVSSVNVYITIKER